MTDIMHEFERRRLRLEAMDKESFSHNRELFFVALQARGVTSVEIRYEGSGDSGGIEDRTVLPDGTDLSDEIMLLVADWHQEKLVTKAMPLIEALDETAMQLVEREHGGWENNEGGGGTVTFDVEPREILVEHHDYYIQRDEYSHSY